MKILCVYGKFYHLGMSISILFLLYICISKSCLCGSFVRVTIFKLVPPARPWPVAAPSYAIASNPPRWIRKI